ncbi:MAG: PorT family protein [Flavobacterium sp.]|nr:PorT family protein [Flavobacterium sp.]
MKKITLSILGLLAFGYASAQDGGTRFGAKAGLNMASISGDIEDAEMKLGFHVGGFAEIMLTDKFAVQPELLFSMQGAKREYSESFGGFDFDTEEKLNLTYINVPIMAKYYVTEAFNIHAGPQVGFLMSAKYDYEVSGAGESESGDEDVKDQYKSIDFGLGFGLGYNFGENFGVEARYTAGMANIADVDEDSDYKESNSVIQVSFLYRF